jgi:hypothetical protein
VKTEEINYLGVFLTFDCTRGCPYCLNKDGGSLERRATIEGKRWIESLNRLDTNVPLTFNGGDPFLHPDFYTIVNGLNDSLKIDLLTTLPIDAVEFMENLNPTKFTRDLPYSAIRVTYHPEVMELDTTIDKVRAIKKAGFDIMINLVDHPHLKPRTDLLKDRILKSGISCVIKPFLGYQDDILYGQFQYVDACSRRFRRNVQCKTSVMLIDPVGNIYRCHRDLFSGNPKGLLGNIFKDDFDLINRYRGCDNFGHCHPCDVQTKYDRFGNWNYVTADITGGDVEVVENSKSDWR